MYRPISAARLRSATPGHHHVISLTDTRQDFSIFFGADTYIGPAYFAVGYDASGSTAIYLYLGRSFRF